MKKLALLALTAAFGLTSTASFAADTSAPVAIHKAKKAEKKVKKDASAQKASRRSFRSGQES
jgi:hypothetical protein